ncbi:MAG: chloramphenicol acetyltransferase [Sulfobacillus acidophilus]|uniref:Chloramphenicol acetyltransferase n=1 Tax=Sulfobacillus acidophilus TaxID=53633 RepID=A0A2T2WN01_9FIRM|nr:MAG: chloramphenicol acetyltransferase [Sulfobacillus acidophilus]
MADGGPDLSLVRHLKSRGRWDEARLRLEVWLNADPENPRLLYEMALVLDNQGREEEAIAYYQQALAGDLDQMHRVDAMLGLGSSLRAVGRVHESYQVLADATSQYPNHLALKVFFAFTLERMGNHGDALTELLDVILESGRSDSLDLYRAAIQYARDHRHDGKLPREQI